MKARKLGNSGLEVAAIGLGCMGLNFGYGLTRFAADKKATPAQFALAWLLAQKPWFVPISGTTKFHRLEENFGAVHGALTADDLTEIERAAAAIEGERYPEKSMATIGL